MVLFQRGSNFLRGYQMLISIKTHTTYDFPAGGGGSGPLSPLWIRACIITFLHPVHPS